MVTKTIRAACLLGISLGLSGCAPTAAQLENADYGPYPKQYKEVINAWLDRTLVDPDSKKVEFRTQPVKEYSSSASPGYGWVVCGYVNAKNRMGGYAGRAPFWAMIWLDTVTGGDVARGGNNLNILAPSTCRNNL